MIKLLWNTHNQTRPDLNNKNQKELVDYNWGIYHKKNSDKWIFEILNKINFQIIESEQDLESEDILIIVDSSVEKRNEFYSKLKIICSKMYLIHLGDESGAYDLTEIYNNFNYVWRTFCLSNFFKHKKVSCLPIGYKSGTSLKRKISNRKYKWSFIGTPHRSSRHDILFQLSEIKPSYCHKTSKFNEKIIEADEMSEVLSSTEFVPCPNGFFHPETYRIYETLECECIPIVENAFKYYDRLFPNNPFIKIDKWLEAKLIIKSWSQNQILKKREECVLWWNAYKDKLKNDMKKKIKQ